VEVLIGCVIGTVLGLTGAGGSVFAVPLFIFVLGLTPSQAIGLSLGAVAAAAIFGSLVRLRSGDIVWLPASVYALLGASVAPVGQWISHQISSQVLMTGFALLVVFIAVRMWQQAKKKPEHTNVLRAGDALNVGNSSAICRVNNRQPFKIGLPCVLGVSGGAIITGLLSGLFGVGGGFLIVPTLLFLTGISIQQAVATSLVVIGAISSAGFISYALSDAVVSLSTLALIAVGCAIGVALGVVLSKKVAGPALQKIFSVLMLVTASITLIGSY